MFILFTLLEKIWGEVSRVFKEIFMNQLVDAPTLSFSITFIDELYIYFELKICLVNGRHIIRRPIFLRFIQLWDFTSKFMPCIFDTCRRCRRIFVLCFWNISGRYTCYKCSTMILALEECNTVNWFQFIISNKMTRLVSIFNIELVSLITKWMFPVVLCLRLYPFKLVPTQLELPIIPTIIGLPNILRDLSSFIPPYFINWLLLIEVSL